MSRVRRRTAVLVALVLAGAVLATAAAPWVTATTTSPLAAAVPLTVSGHTAVPLVTAGALVAAAGALALSLGGWFAARVAGAGVVLGGGLVLASAVGVLADPVPSAEAAARAAVGVTTLTAGPHVQPAVHASLVLGAALVVVGAVATVAAGRWAVADARHRAPAHDGPAAPPRAVDGATLDERDAWDALSRGEDPT